LHWNEDAGVESEPGTDCPPQLLEAFTKVYDAERKQCDVGGCPGGQRKETIGQKFLVNCEPWLHEPRPCVHSFIARPLGQSAISLVHRPSLWFIAHRPLLSRRPASIPDRFRKLLQAA
jgi:hypothetical protein